MCGFFEVHAENYMGEGGMPCPAHGIRERYPVSLHGVGLSIGFGPPARRGHLLRLRAWSGATSPRCSPSIWHGRAMARSSSRPSAASLYRGDACARQRPYRRGAGGRLPADAARNPSTYLVFDESTIPEVEFLREIARRTGCGLLLDVNNVFISAANHHTSAQAYLDAFPLGLSRNPSRRPRHGQR